MTVKFEIGVEGPDSLITAMEKLSQIFTMNEIAGMLDAEEVHKEDLIKALYITVSHLESLRKKK